MLSEWNNVFTEFLRSGLNNCTQAETEEILI